MRRPARPLVTLVLLAGLLSTPALGGTAAAQLPLGFVLRSGTQLTLDGLPRRFTGVNAYHLASDFSFNYGCGDNNTQADLDALFSSLRPLSMVRVFAFQHMAFNKNTGAIDFSRIDRVVGTAQRYGHKLVLVLANQYGNCDTPSYKDEAWYAGGYKQVFNAGTYNGGTSGRTTPLSYWDYLLRIVPRYANSPAVAMWQPVNEPRSAIVNADGSQTCSLTAAATLRKFFDTVGGAIHVLAPKQLVGSAVIGQGNCGAKGAEYETLHASPGIDVGSYHDYNYDSFPMPGDQWNGLAVRIAQMNRVGKPLIIDEVGMKAADGIAGCMTLAQRRDKIKAKMDAQLPQGIDVYLPWVWTKSTVNSCSLNIKAGDPTLTLLRNYVL
jgi:mannan endo-1,4-beta-mannosidase